MHARCARNEPRGGPRPWTGSVPDTLRHSRTNAILLEPHRKPRELSFLGRRNAGDVVFTPIKRARPLKGNPGVPVATTRRHLAPDRWMFYSTLDFIIPPEHRVRFRGGRRISATTSFLAIRPAELVYRAERGGGVSAARGHGRHGSWIGSLEMEILY